VAVFALSAFAMLSLRDEKPAWRWRWAACLFVLFGASGSSSANVLFELADGDPIINVAPQLSVLEDPTDSLGVNDVLSPALAGRFVPLAGNAASFGFSTSAWWLRFDLRNSSSEPITRVLRQNYPMLDRIEVWVIADGQVTQHWLTGDRLPFSTRPIEHRDFLFPLTIPANSHYSVLVRAASGGPINVPLTLYQPFALITQVATEQLALGALFGSILLLASIVLVLFVFVRDASFLYYLFYLLTYGSYMAAFNGIAYQYVMSDSPELASAIHVMLLLAALFFLLQFAKSILHIGRVAPKVGKFTAYIQLMVVAVLVASPFFDYSVIVLPISGLIVVTMLLVMAMGIASHRAGQPTARFFLLAWSAFLIGVLAYMLKSFGLLPHNLLTQYGFQIGTIFEFVLLSLALGVRVQEIKQQSRTDSLTGLGNRASLDELVSQQFASCAAANAPLSLLIVDIDLFKQVNDVHGHALGDRVLQRVAASIRRAPRQPSQAFRYGGEEFVILLPRTALEVASELAERLRAEIEGDDREPRVTISIGLACTSTRQCTTTRDLFRAADEALYAAKRGGRNRVVADDARDRRELVSGGMVTA